MSGQTEIPHKVLHVPNIDFSIHQLALNPSGKLLAIAGAFQVAVVVLPRAGYTKLVSSSIECKYVFSSPLMSCVYSIIGQSKWDNSIMGLHPRYPFARLTGIRGERQDQRSWS